MSDEASGPALLGEECRVPSHPGWSEPGRPDWRVDCRHLRRGLLRFLFALGAAVLGMVEGHAAPALPGEPCQVDPRETWSETEQWVWNQVCIGEIANLNEHFDAEGPSLDPRYPEGWTEERKLSSRFLETILLHDPWRSAIFARIGGNLDLQGAAVAGLDLTGTRVDGALRLTSPERLATGADGAVLVLVNTRVGAVQAEPAAWPMRLDLDGFTYDRFGGLGEDPEAAVGARGSAWFVRWLGRDDPYSPQPYEQLARVLREMAHPEMADDVLYAGRERERGEAWQRGENLRWLGLSMLNWTIGYGHGHRFFWALYWVIGLVLIGTVVLGVTGQNQRDNGKMIGIWYSLDMLLPIVQLRKEHYDLDLEGFARYWFYGHKLMGYVLASFLIAGLAGLTK